MNLHPWILISVAVFALSCKPQNRVQTTKPPHSQENIMDSSRAGLPDEIGVWRKSGDDFSFRSDEKSGTGNVFLGFAALDVGRDHSQVWVDALAEGVLLDRGTHHFLAVRGPKGPDFRRDTMDFSALLSELKKVLGHGDGLVTLAAHSDGVHAAVKFVNYSASQLGYHVLKKIHFLNLDGVSEGIDKNFVSLLRKVTFVYAIEESGAIFSRNYNSNFYAALPLRGLASVKELRLRGTGCVHPDCVHEALINRVPHNPKGLDVVRNYTVFRKPSHVQSDYLEE